MCVTSPAPAACACWPTGSATSATNPTTAAARSSIRAPLRLVTGRRFRNKRSLRRSCGRWRYDAHQDRFDQLDHGLVQLVDRDDRIVEARLDRRRHHASAHGRDELERRRAVEGVEQRTYRLVD